MQNSFNVNFMLVNSFIINVDIRIIFVQKYSVNVVLIILQLQKYLLPPALEKDRSKKCIVIDLDETLVHSSFKVGCFLIMRNSVKEYLSATLIKTRMY